MGTNFYLKPRPACECCGREFETLHIGKSSYGWCFSLHIIPEKGINTLGDWINRWNSPTAEIEDEYGGPISPMEMENIITSRSHPAKTDWDQEWWNPRSTIIKCSYTSEADFHAKNHSERGPNFLLRHRVDGVHCSGHGDGTYDYILGEFS